MEISILVTVFISRSFAAASDVLNPHSAFFIPWIWSQLRLSPVILNNR